MTTENLPIEADLPTRDAAWSVFLVFLRLGVTSFGGPIAHLGYLAPGSR